MTTSPSQSEIQVDADTVRDVVDEVFQDPSLREGLELPDPGGSEWLEDLQHEALLILLRVLEFLASVWDDVTEPLSGLPTPLRILSYVVVFALVGYLIFMLAKLRRGSRAAAGSKGLTDAEDAEGPLRFGDLVREAERQAAANDRRSAARSLLLALLALIEERQVLAIARGWTNREIVARLPLQEPYAGELRGFARVVDGVAYGGVDITTSDFARLKEVLDHVVSGLRRLRPDAGDRSTR